MRKKLIISLLSLGLTFTSSLIFANDISATELAVSDNNIEVTEIDQTVEVKVSEETDTNLQLEASAKEAIDSFVERCYNITLNRQSDAAGKTDWTRSLESGRKSGAEIVIGFVKSQEYTNQNKSNEAYVTDLYKLCMGREPDAAGFKDWVSQLTSGKSRDEVMAGFVNSKEFTNICFESTISRGTLQIVNSNASAIFVPGADTVVSSLYTNVLERDAEAEGKENWIYFISKDNMSSDACVNMASGFYFSAEYQGKLNQISNQHERNQKFVRDCYRGALRREPDTEGFNNWVSLLDSGIKTQKEVVEGFYYSQEFINFVNTCKLKITLDPSTDLSKVGEDRSPSGVPVGTTVNLPGGGTFYQGNGYQVYSGMGVGDAWGVDDDPNLPHFTIGNN